MGLHAITAARAYVSWVVVPRAIQHARSIRVVVSEIVNRRSQEHRVVSETAKSDVAFVAEQSAHESCGVVVVNMQFHVGATADSTLRALAFLYSAANVSIRKLSDFRINDVIDAIVRALAQMIAPERPTECAL